MLQQMLELARNTLTKKQFHEFMELVTTDIKVNRIAWGKRTNLADAVEIAEITWRMLQRVA